MLFALLLLGMLWPRPVEAASYVHIRLGGVINPIKARYVKRALARAEDDHAELVVVSIDTPGGLVSSMEEITGAITNARVVVVGFVEPISAQATSAGAFILLATDIAAMAPHTQVGAAHPVGSEGKDLDAVMNDKATNSLVALAKSLAARRGRPPGVAEAMVRESKSYTAEEAKQGGAIEIIASDVDDLLSQLDGRDLDLVGGKRTLHTGGLTPIALPLSWPERLLDVLADPTIASILLSLGVLGILYELAAPGIGMAGIVGVVSLLTALAAMSLLPLELGGLLLLVVGFAAIAVELKVQAHGMLAAGGIAALVLGALLLVDRTSYFGATQLVDWRLFGPFVGGTTVAFLLLARVALRSLRAPPQTGSESISGRRGRAKTTFSQTATGHVGSVFVDGARWEAECDQAVEEGDPIVVVAVLSEPMRLRVLPVERGET